MSADSNISKFPTLSNQSNAITLDAVIQAITEWRLAKDTRNDPIPEIIWDKIMLLLNKFPESMVCTTLGITKSQLKNKREEKSIVTPAQSHIQEVPTVDFCEAKQEPARHYKAARIPATNTLVVEFCRSDGRIMKIHTTTDSFAELMKAFFAGG